MFMAERCGSWQVGDDRDAGAVEFRVFYPAGVDPGVTDIRVIGDFQPHVGGSAWDPATGLPLVRDDTDPRGTFWRAESPTPLPSDFYAYAYAVRFADGSVREVADPCARYSGLTPQRSGIVVGGSRPADNVVRPLAGGRRPLGDLGIYELMIDDFTAGYRGGRAPLRAVMDRLDHVAGLGFDAIEFMPWTAWRHVDFDWGYEPFQYFAVESRYANDADGPAERLSWLKRLVSACHDRGLHVIMDGVFNHVSPAFPYRFLYADPTDCPFTAEPFGGSFPGLQDLDFRHPMTGEFVLDVCRYWTQTFDLDGIRFDNTVNFLVPGDLRGLPELLTGLEEELVRTDRSHFSLTLEHLRLDAAAVTNATRATSFWDDSLFQAARTGLERGRIDGALLAALDNRRFLDQGKVPTLYLSNHDHSQLGWLAGAREQVGATGAWWRMQPYVIALLTATAVPLVPNGQEFGEEHWLPEDDHGTGRRVTGRPLRWKIAGDPIGQTLMALFRRLLHLRREHPALRSPLIYPEAWEPAWGELTDVGVGVAADRQLVVYHRWAELADAVENVVVVLNFGDAFQTVRTPFPLQGTWTDLLAGFDGMGPPWTLGVNGSTAEVPVGSHWGRVLHKTTARVP